MHKAIVCLTLLALLAIWVSACASAAPTSTPKPAPTGTPQASQQLTAGMEAYNNTCSRCHGAKLNDGSAPQLVPAALARFGTAQGLLGFLTRSHDRADLSKLPTGQLYDILAYVLSQQGLLKAGQVLSADTAASVTLTP